MRFTLSALQAALLFVQLLPLHALALGQDTSVPPGFRTQAEAVAPDAPLTLAQAVELAQTASPQLRASALNIAIAEGAEIQAGLLPNPELSYLKEGTQRGNRTQTTQLSQLVELGGKRSARIALAAQDRLLAARALDTDRAQLRADVITAYLDTLTAQEHVNLSQQSVQLAAKAANAADRRVAAGKISPVEQTRSTVAAANARIELTQALAELDLVKRRLAALWGSTAPLTRPLVTPELDLASIPSLAELMNRLDAAPQLQRARGQVTRDEAQLSLERAQRIPDVTVTVGTKKDDQLGRSQTIVGLAVPFPLFNRNQGNLLSAQRRIERARAEFDVERITVSKALADSHARAVVSQQQLTSLRSEVLPAAQSAYDAAVTGFELGKFGFLDVLDAQRTLFQAREQYLTVLAERYRAAAELQRYAAVAPQPSTGF